ncbi:MAG TPA: ABC-type transport auxiliary lipoprotein family protein [Thermohalobaculum sp.]|nr:ABC-type transport auxiliary lipoprotein family protein [Thermohalobaculum sp.]
MPRRLIAALALGLGLAGCTPVSQFMALGDRVEAVTEPIALYVLTPKSTFDPGLPEVRRQLVIEEPIAASHLDTDRIAVKPGPYRVEYFPEVRWADRAPLLVRRLLVESFENTRKVASVSAQRIGLASDFLLFTDLREFQAATPPAEGDPVLVNVQLNLKIVEEQAGLIIASANFGEVVAAESEDPATVVVAFDQALGTVLKDSVEWAVRTIAGWSPEDGPLPLGGETLVPLPDAPAALSG